MYAQAEAAICSLGALMVRNMSQIKYTFALHATLLIYKKHKVVQHFIMNKDDIIKTL